jgi:hypothetical protein
MREQPIAHRRHQRNEQDPGQAHGDVLGRRKLEWSCVVEAAALDGKLDNGDSSHGRVICQTDARDRRRFRQMIAVPAMLIL